MSIVYNIKCLATAAIWVVGMNSWSYAENKNVLLAEPCPSEAAREELVAHRELPFLPKYLVLYGAKVAAEEIASQNICTSNESLEQKL